MIIKEDIRKTIERLDYKVESYDQAVVMKENELMINISEYKAENYRISPLHYTLRKNIIINNYIFALLLIMIPFH